ncbi:MAG: tRNA dihydrouridine(20/20a) synthase DusA [Pseudomonadota bacterium]
MAARVKELGVLDASRLSVAPMMDWTDRHCRVLHRRLSSRALLYTEMVVASAVVRGDAARLLRWTPEREGVVALQLGGSDPAVLAEAVRIACGFGYHEINLNVGCPSDKVRDGRFGAVLMREPALVAECLAAMIRASAAEGGPPVTVKCRIGVDEQTPGDVLPDFIDRCADAGVRQVTIHARKAWLKGLSPKENRQVPPLDYDLAREMKARRSDLSIVLNGGIDALSAAEAHLAQGFDGVMIGRAAYHEPGAILAAADRRVFGAPGPDADEVAAALAMMPYIDAELAGGEKLHRITRHMLGLFSGRRGARAWRRILSEGARGPGAGPELIERALAEVAQLAA